MTKRPENEAAAEPAGPRIRLGVSTCLLGENVRHDGGHKRDTWLLGGIGPWVEWVPVCPEVEVGMGTPREAVRLVGDAGAPNMVGVRSGRDWTEDLRRWSEERLERLRALRLHGFVLTKNSPSCGLFRVKRYDANGVPSKDARGLWASALTRAFPLLPVEEDGRLCDPRLRENFLDRVFAHERWTRFLDEDGSRKGIVRFHTVHKLTVLSHSPRHYRDLGRLVAEAGKTPIERLRAEYGDLLLAAMAHLATPGRHANVLEHLAGFLKRDVPADDREEVRKLIGDYRAGLVPLVVPVTLLRHHLRRIPGAEWATEQVYLNPYPKELMLRNHV